MKLSGKTWEKYIEALKKVNDKAAEQMKDFLLKNPNWKDPEVVQKIIDYAYYLATKYGEAAAAVACEMYDAVAALSGVNLDPALPAKTATYLETAKTVNGTLASGNEEIISASVGRLSKMAGVDTTMNNAIRDGAEWAWVPRGDTCAFCITLASRGWEQASKKAMSGGHATHIHANCDCTYAIRFSSKDTVEGYDPREYYDFYRSQPGKDKINSMRRAIYAEKKDEINAQKRSAYAKRQERNSSEAEEMNIE